MNDERLHAVLEKLGSDKSFKRSLSLMQTAESTLQQMVAQPSQQGLEKALSTTLTSLYDSLDQAESNSFSTSWHDVLVALDIAPYVGVELKGKISEIFESNKITPTLALTRIQEINEYLASIDEASEQVVAGFSTLGIGTEQLAAGDSDVGVVIPRAAVSNRLRSLGAELIELHKILTPFQQLVDGKDATLEIEQISSTEFSFLLEAPFVTASAIAVGVERLVALYKNILETKVIRRSLEEKNMGEHILKLLDEQIHQSVRDGIEETIDELLHEYGGDEERRTNNELATKLRFSLKALADRIDAGYDIEVRTAPEEPLEDGEGELVESDQRTQTRIASIHRASEAMKYLERDDKPILRLSKDDNGAKPPRPKKPKSKKK